jgi:hypothetical protein
MRVGIEFVRSLRKPQGGPQEQPPTVLNTVCTREREKEKEKEKERERERVRERERERDARESDSKTH